MALWLMSTVMEAGEIEGTVRAEARAGVEEKAGGGAYASRKYKFVERIDYDALRDFVVFIEGPLEGTNSPPPGVARVVTNPRVSQRGAMFEPRVLPVLKGTVVEWPNNDDIYHNVFSISEPKPFDLGLYKSGEFKQVAFDKAGRVDVFCSIHTSMSCIVLVMDNPYFAATDARGGYVITNVPPGTYTLKAWHERLPTQDREVTVPEEGRAKVDFVLGVRGLPQY
jgi:plastocyanin